MKKIWATILLFIVVYQITNASYNNIYGPIISFEKKVVNFGINICEEGTYSQSDIPTIFVPGILASWYSESGYEE